MDSCQNVALNIVIVNYRTPDLVIGCLESLAPELELISASFGEPRVAVVDNDSGDDSVSLLSQWRDQQSPSIQERIQILPSKVNGGFAAGNNLGIQAQPADYQLLLNSDTIVRAGSILTLLKNLSRKQKVGLMGPRLEFLDGYPQESCFRDQGIISEFLRGAQLDLAFRVFHKKVVAIPVDEATQTAIDWTSFACVLIRSAVFADIGLMDEKYFMYFEDSEFCARARRAGWLVEHEPDARVVHLRGGSSSVKRRSAQKKRLPAYFYESRSRYFVQSGGLITLALANVAWLLGRGLCQVKRLFGKPADGAIKREWLDIWTIPKSRHS